jgi:hypothetical protein
LIFKQKIRVETFTLNGYVSTLLFKLSSKKRLKASNMVGVTGLEPATPWADSY